jgi:hypothetical protein
MPLRKTVRNLGLVLTLLVRGVVLVWRNRKPSFRRIPPRPPPSRPSSFQLQDCAFFNLPREVRDLIYRHYWTLHPRLSASREHLANPLSMRLHYDGRESADNSAKKFYWDTYEH